MDYSSREIERNLLKTTTDPELRDLLKDYVELGIDAVFNTEIVDAIPVVRSFSAALKGVATIQDRIFLKKLAHFLSSANNMTIDERDAWYERHIHGDEKIEEKLADKLMIIIDSVNDNYKADVIGKLFMAFIKGDVDTLEHYYYMCELAASCHTSILKGLSEGRTMDDVALFRAGIKHASTPTGEDISKMLDRDAELTSMGMSSIPSLPRRNVPYTPEGELLMHVLRNY